MNTKPSTTASAMNIVPSSSHDYVGKLKKNTMLPIKIAIQIPEWLFL